jgi:hypothetical protein
LILVIRLVFALQELTVDFWDDAVANSVLSFEVDLRLGVHKEMSSDHLRFIKMLPVRLTLCSSQLKAICDFIDRIHILHLALDGSYERLRLQVGDYH